MSSSQGSPLLADNNGLLFVETSALDSTNVEEAFETILKGTGTGAVVQQLQGIAGSLSQGSRAGQMMCSTSLPAPLELFGASFMRSFGIVFLAALVFSLWCWAFHSPHPKLCSHGPWASLRPQGLLLPGNLQSPSCCLGLMTWCLQHPAKPAVGTWGARG